MSKDYLLLTGDIHLDDRPLHQYRWRSLVTMTRHLESLPCKGLIIAGDLVDAKDNHRSAFVNRLAKYVKIMSDIGKPIILLRGNHDYIEKSEPFFSFLGMFNNVTYVTEISVVKINGWKIMFIPNGEPWPATKKKYDLIVCHETFGGAKGENGIELKGKSTKEAARSKWGCLVLSGDIHTPQSVGNVTYIGAPHPVKFGDDYKTRMLAWYGATQKVRELPTSTIRRWSMKGRLLAGGKFSCKEMKQVRDGDHVTIQVTGPLELAPEWPRVKRLLTRRVEALGAVLFASSFIPDTAETTDAQDFVQITDPFKEYCAAKDVPESFMKVGKAICDECR